MSTIIDYVNELERQKRKLVSILNTLNVQSDDTETFNELIPKILQIYGITYFIHCKDKFSPITVDKASDISITLFSDNVDASAQVTTQSGYDVNTYVYNPDLDVYSISACNAGGLWSGYRPPSSGGTIVPVLGTNGLIKYHISCNRGDFYYSFITLNNYLATINNLETPITKTNTNTMKVIYTIQET